MAGISKWMDKSFAKEMLYQGLRSLKEAFMLLVRVKEENGPTIQPFTGNKETDNCFFSDLLNVEDKPLTNDGLLFELSKELDLEIDLFIKLVKDRPFVITITNTSDFWIRYKHELSKLRTLYTIAQNIPSTSA